MLYHRNHSFCFHLLVTTTGGMVGGSERKKVDVFFVFGEFCSWCILILSETCWSWFIMYIDCLNQSRHQYSRAVFYQIHLVSCKVEGDFLLEYSNDFSICTQEHHFCCKGPLKLHHINQGRTLTSNTCLKHWSHFYRKYKEIDLWAIFMFTVTESIITSFKIICRD